jgi:hypothetical protein
VKFVSSNQNNKLPGNILSDVRWARILIWLSSVTWLLWIIQTWLVNGVGYWLNIRSLLRFVWFLLSCFHCLFATLSDIPHGLLIWGLAWTCFFVTISWHISFPGLFDQFT